MINMDKSTLISYLEHIDAGLKSKADICIYGSAACILLDEPGRTSLDVDVAAPYSHVNFYDFKEAARSAGLPVNPDEDYQGEHIEWISDIRLCLSRPVSGTEVVLWEGEFFTVKTVAVPDLIASKLIRYDEIDQSDIQYLCSQSRVEYSEIKAAAERLPQPFNHDRLVLENLQNLKADLNMWRE